MYYYLLSARLPFLGEDLGRLIRLHRLQPVPDVRRVAPEVPAEVVAIINRLLAKAPVDRYGSVSQVPGVEAVARGDAYVGY